MNRIGHLFIIILSLLIGVSCSNKSEDVIILSADRLLINKWDNYFDEINYIFKKDNVIILFVRSADCNKYKDEIIWWNNNFNTDESTDLILVILEKYTAYYDVALSVLDIQIPAYQDHRFLALHNELIRTIPAKVFIDKKNQKIGIGKMGTVNSIKNFLAHTPK